jgi:hypothetical protein
VLDQCWSKTVIGTIGEEKDRLLVGANSRKLPQAGERGGVYGEF